MWSSQENSRDVGAEAPAPLFLTVATYSKTPSDSTSAGPVRSSSRAGTAGIVTLVVAVARGSGTGVGGTAAAAARGAATSGAATSGAAASGAAATGVGTATGAGTAATGAGATTGAGAATGGVAYRGAVAAATAGCTSTQCVAPPTKTCDGSRISTRWHWRPGSSRRKSSVSRRAVPGIRSIVPFCSMGLVEASW